MSDVSPAMTLLRLRDARDEYAASNIITAFDACNIATRDNPTDALVDLLNALLVDEPDVRDTHDAYAIAYGLSSHTRNNILTMFASAIARIDTYPRNAA